ncbi:SnoaL-like domain-containing protein [Favolaschia claudopus]|uniref:SnoaL-like domain-containing protein n=1 Tax=Favolaschia claudopus TaxID=2862362 RepID=A0AAW0BDL8_9AGAR
MTAESLQAKQLENAQAFFSCLNAYNFHGMADLLTADFTHEYFPSSLNPPEGKFKRSKDETVQLFKNAWEKVIDGMQFLPPLDIIQGQNAVVFHVKSDGTSKSGKRYNNEYMITLRFSGVGIVHMKEFVDTKYVADFFGA